MFYNTNNSAYNIRPANELFDVLKNEHVTIKVGSRCCCWRRIDFDIQCKYELKISPLFIGKNWAHRWYNRKYFNSVFPNLSNFLKPDIIDL